MSTTRFRAVLTIGIAAFVFAAIPSSGLAAASDLDPTFGSGGKVITDVSSGIDRGNSVAVQGDGKIVVAGQCIIDSNYVFCLTRYNDNGSLDTTFDGDGKVTTAIGALGGVAVQGDGKIVATGQCPVDATIDFCLVRYNSNGSLDTTFDGDGEATTAIGVGADVGTAVAVQANGKIVVAGYCLVGPTYVFCLARYNSNGSLDTTLDGDGKLTTDMGADIAYAQAVAVHTGKIIVAGRCTGSTDDFCLARYNGDGSLDTTFDSDGKVTTAIGVGFDLASSVAVQGGGKVVAAGSCAVGAAVDFCLVRYNGDGSLDTSFDGDGKVTTDIAAGSDAALAVAVQGDGKIVAAGQCFVGSNSDFCLARYNGGGGLDTSFDGDGKVTTDIGAGYDLAAGVAIQGDGKIVAAGQCAVGSSDAFCLARYEGSPPVLLAPSSLVASPLSRSQIGLTWTDNATNETGFRIERSFDGSSGWRQVATVGADVTTFTHSRQPALTTYFYRVRATNAAGDSGSSNVASATTLSG